MDDGGNNRDDLTLPKGTSDAEALAKQLKDDFENGKELVVTVLKVKYRSLLSVLSGALLYFPSLALLEPLALALRCLSPLCQCTRTGRPCLSTTSLRLNI